ncbi:MAG: hypothetical protein JO035_01110 [Betaproteobacteria bacterium]|nr:hypothetical protein [Betaproteobacteria bacterium]
MTFILQTLKHTPWQVYVLFAGLVYLGHAQTKARSVSMLRVALLPLLVVPASFAGLVSLFGPRPEVIGGWLLAAVGAAALALYLRYPRGVTYDAAARVFHVPGSRVPFALIMALFFVRYTIAVALVRNPDLKALGAFALCAGIAFGISNGIFVGRALQIRRSRPALPGAKVSLPEAA